MGVQNTVKSKLKALYKQAGLRSRLVQLVSHHTCHVLNKASRLDEDCTQTLPVSLLSVTLRLWLKPLHLLKLR